MHDNDDPDLFDDFINRNLNVEPLHEGDDDDYCFTIHDEDGDFHYAARVWIQRPHEAEPVLYIRADLVDFDEDEEDEPETEAVLPPPSWKEAFLRGMKEARRQEPVKKQRRFLLLTGEDWGALFLIALFLLVMALFGDRLPFNSMRQAQEQSATTLHAQAEQIRQLEATLQAFQDTAATETP